MSPGGVTIASAVRSGQCKKGGGDGGENDGFLTAASTRLCSQCLFSFTPVSLNGIPCHFPLEIKQWQGLGRWASKVSSRDSTEGGTLTFEVTESWTS